MKVVSSSSTRPPTLKDLNEAFLDDTIEPDVQPEKFGVVAKRFLCVDVNDEVWVKLGTVVAYHGDFKITRERIITTKPGRMLGREYAPLVRVIGKGRIYCADEGKRSTIMHLAGHTINVVSSALMAFEPSIEHQCHLVGKVGLLAGGLFSFKLSGTGVVVLGTKGDPLTLRVTPDRPVVTDPDCTLAWTDALTPELKTHLEWRTLLGHGGGEAIHMLFRGEGYVVVHAKEEIASKRGLFGTVKSLVKKLSPF